MTTYGKKQKNKKKPTIPSKTPFGLSLICLHTIILMSSKSPAKYFSYYTAKVPEIKSYN